MLLLLLLLTNRSGVSDCNNVALDKYDDKSSKLLDSKSFSHNFNIAKAA
ncbi:unnamed protein product [Schistosoma mattheei]|uniref:Uncharacterized protein n=1 Tax=Schistosoma mattheei TaxID=31246 RepID=A0A183NY89_9TREM|nr:unnamed protein product [Schistosoma mattheei]